MLRQAAPHAGVRMHADNRDVLIASQRIRSRRRWFFRAAVSFALSATLLIVLVLLQRDRMTANDSVRSLDRPLVALQAEIDELGQLPAVFPGTPDRLGMIYASNLIREYARQTTEPVIIAHSTLCPLILRSDGNSVVIFENGKVRCEWWPHTEVVHELYVQSAKIRRWDQSRRSELPQLP